MTASRFERIGELFQRAVELPPDEQDQFLADECADETDIAREVRELLEQDRQPHRVFQADVATLSERLSGHAGKSLEDTPSRIGNYTVVRRIGEGGMAVLYLAEQSQPKRRVAIKLLKRGLVTAGRMRRFRLEVQVLGQLHHPCIAQIFDAGSFDLGDGARPYFAMEYVEGPRITDFVREQQLDLRARLRLMIAVCQAVNHAHQRGVIHRDLKPGNVLVHLEPTTASDESTVASSGAVLVSPRDSASSASPGAIIATPKVLDFGIARVIGSEFEDSTMHTREGQLVGTLAYMSPEQVSGDPAAADVRSDVYALGVMLYEVLTGRLPYDVRDKPLPQVVSAITDSTPAPMSRCDRSLEGDLEIIIAKALAKEKSERYQTALAFSEDLSRYLEDEPILARPPSTWYRLRKFSQRNRALVGLTITIMVLIVASSVVSTVLLFMARQQSHLKEQQALEARWQSYVANIAAAHAAIRSGNAAEARALLDAAPEELRNWEWHLLNGQLGRSEVLFRSSQGVKSIALNADESLLYVGDDSGTLTALNPRTHDVVAQARAHPYWIHGVAYNEAANRVATCAEDGVVRLWNADSLKYDRGFPLSDQRIEAIAWLPDGQHLLAGGWDNTIREIDATTGEVSRTWRHDATIASIVVSPDGHFMTSLDSMGTVRRWNLATGDMLAQFHWRGPHQSKHATLDAPGTVAAFGDGAGLASVFNLTTGELLAQFHAHDSRALRFAFSPDGSFLATSGHDSRIRLWETTHYKLVAEFIDHALAVGALVFNHDGTMLVSGSGDRTVRAWPIDASTVHRLTGHNDWVYSVDLFDSGHRLLSSSGHTSTVAVWNLDQNSMTDRMQREQGPIIHAARMLEKDDRAVYVYDKVVSVWDRSVGTSADVPTSSAVSQFDLSGDQSWVACVHFDENVIDVVDVASQAVVDQLEWASTEPATTNVLRQVAIDPTRPIVVAGTWPELVWWDRSTGTYTIIDLRKHSSASGVGTLEFSPDGSVLAVGMRGEVLCLDTATQTMRSRLACGSPTTEVTDVVFTSDGHRLLATDARGVLRLWDLPSFRHVASLQVSDQSLLCMDIASDDSVLVTGSIDQTIRVLRIQP